MCSVGWEDWTRGWIEVRRVSWEEAPLPMTPRAPQFILVKLVVSYCKYCNVCGWRKKTKNKKQKREKRLGTSLLQELYNLLEWYQYWISTLVWRNIYSCSAFSVKAWFRKGRKSDVFPLLAFIFVYSGPQPLHLKQWNDSVPLYDLYQTLRTLYRLLVTQDRTDGFWGVPYTTQCLCDLLQGRYCH